MKVFVLLGIVGACVAQYGGRSGGYGGGQSRSQFSGYSTTGFSGVAGRRAGGFSSSAAGYTSENGNFLSRSAGGFSSVTSGYPSGRAGGFTASRNGYSSGTLGTNGYYGGNQYARQGDNFDNSEPARHEFKYDVNDQQYGVEFGHQEQRDGDYSQGSYYVLLPDGKRQLVEYTADLEGYHPRISYQDVSQYSANYGQGNGFGRSGNYRSGDYNTGGYQSGSEASRHGLTSYQIRRNGGQAGY